MINKAENLNKSGKPNWNNIFFMVLFHAGALVALFMPLTWQTVALVVFMWWLSGSLGVGVGFHRLLTHRGYKAPKWLEYSLTFLGLLALEGGAIQWVVTHRIHHSMTDASGDPHTPRDGKWWSHMGWILRGTSQQHEDSVMQRYAPDLLKDPVHVWLNKLYYMPLVVTGVVLFAIGGWPLLFWGTFFRVTMGLHFTWLVNSATHLWGSRRFETTDDSTNSWWVALLTFGEGWHNNHHAHPRAARHGLAWYEIDMNWWSIRALQAMGLIRDIKLISKEDLANAERRELRRAA